MRNVKMVSHPENATVHKLLDARSHKGCIVAGSSPVLTTNIIEIRLILLGTPALGGDHRQKIVRFIMGISSIQLALIYQYSQGACWITHQVRDTDGGVGIQMGDNGFESCPDYTFRFITE